MVFLFEVVLVAIILLMTRLVKDAVRTGPAPKLDLVGTVLSATGLGLIVLGTLQSSTWGWIQPKDSPVTPFGFSLTIFVIMFGAMLRWAFVAWQRHREAAGNGSAGPHGPASGPAAAIRAGRAVHARI